MKGKNKIGYIDLLDRSDNPSGTVTDAVAWAQKDYRWWTRLFRCAVVVLSVAAWMVTVAVSYRVIPDRNYNYISASANNTRQEVYQNVQKLFGR